MALDELGSSKASKLMSFLDKIETEIEEDVASSIAVPLEYKETESIADGVSDQHDTESIASTKEDISSSNVFHGIKAKMMRLKEDLKDKTTKIELLELAVSRAEEREKLAMAEHDKEMKRRLLAQKREFEVVTQRHLVFVDRLLSDKEGLSAKCEALSDEVVGMREKYEGKMAKLQATHKRESRRAKEEWAASEQIKREQWVSSKTKQIKSMTIKGLEPEIQRLIEQNKRDLRAKEDEMAEMMRSETETLRASHSETVADLKRKWDDERESEMNAVAQKHSEQIEAMRQCKERELRECGDRHTAEREEERRRSQMLSEEAMAKMSSLHEAEMAKLKQLHLSQIENVEQRHGIERRKEAETVAIEKREWMQIMNRKHAKEAQEKEQAMRTAIEREQREEIEVIIERLSTQYAERLKAAQSHHDDIEGEYKEQILSERQKSKQWIEKMEALNARNATLRADKNEMERHCEAKETEIERLRKAIETLRSEMTQKEAAKDNEIRAKMEQIADSKKKNKAQRNEMELLREEHIRKCKALESEHGDEILEIERRIKQTLCKKDELVMRLKQQLTNKNIRIQQIETLMDS